MHHALALVGAGPRGTSVLERLCASVPGLAPGTRLTVHIVDPAPPGPGQVWRTGQSTELLMNTVASQVTLFTDASVTCEGPIRPGPSLYEWAASPAASPAASERPEAGLGPDDYPTRACYGRYLEWVFRQVVRGAPKSVTVRVHPARAVRLQDAPDSTQTLALDNGETLTRLSAVVLTQGHLPAHPTRSDARLSSYAALHGLHHVPPANPADLDPGIDLGLAALAPGEPVLLRGLGLNFFDHMALLTSGRGGTFTRAPGRTGLVYRPSGREPRLYAGSRRGVPHQARGDNAKGPYGRHEPLLLTPGVIAALRARADAGDPPDFLGEIWPLVAKEVETVYYETLLGPAAPRPTFRARFLAAAHGGAQEADVLGEFGVPHAQRWCWDLTARPQTGRTFRDPADHRDWLLRHLRRDAAHAALGNVAGPRKAALDVLRDLRNELRQIVDHAGLPAASRRDHLDSWYTPLNAFLSIGPPRRRIEEMTALIEAGVLDVIGPRTTVTAEGGKFVAASPDVPGSAVAAGALIEARLPEPDLRRTSDELLARLLKTGQCRPHTVGGYETGGLDVTRRPYRLIDRQGRPHPRRFAFGVPTEGVHWVTAAGARPGVDSVTLTDADAVARAALRAAATTPAGAETGAETGVDAALPRP